MQNGKGRSLVRLPFGLIMGLAISAVTLAVPRLLGATQTGPVWLVASGDLTAEPRQPDQLRVHQRQLSARRQDILVGHPNRSLVRCGFCRLTHGSAGQTGSGILAASKHSLRLGLCQYSRRGFHPGIASELPLSSGKVWSQSVQEAALEPARSFQRVVLWVDARRGHAQDGAAGYSPHGSVGAGRRIPPREDRKPDPGHHHSRSVQRGRNAAHVALVLVAIVGEA
jgi:hypothetical protein